MLGAEEESVGKGVSCARLPGGGEGVLFTHEFIDALLALASNVAICKMVAIKVWMSTAV